MWFLLHHVLVGGRGCPCPPEIKNPLCLLRGLGELHSLEEPVPGQGSALRLLLPLNVWRCEILHP